jgi:hypothetical protein
MPTTQQFFWVALPIFLSFVALEFFILWRQSRAYSWKEGATSLAIDIGNKLSTTYKLGFSIWTTMLVWEHRAFECRLRPGGARSHCSSRSSSPTTGFTV